MASLNDDVTRVSATAFEADPRDPPESANGGEPPAEMPEDTRDVRRLPGEPRSGEPDGGASGTETGLDGAVATLEDAFQFGPDEASSAGQSDYRAARRESARREAGGPTGRDRMRDTVRGESGRAPLEKQPDVESNGDGKKLVELLTQSAVGSVVSTVITTVISS